MARNNYRGSGRTGGSRWMPLRYAGVCKVCGGPIAKGTSAFYDAAARTVTCQDLDCCEADGLTTVESPTGPWDKRTDLRKRLERRLGAAAPIPPRPPRVVTARFNSGGVAWVNANGRCEDAPCCGCCS